MTANLTVYNPRTKDWGIWHSLSAGTEEALLRQIVDECQKAVAQVPGAIPLAFVFDSDKTGAAMLAAAETQ